MKRMLLIAVVLCLTGCNVTTINITNSTLTNVNINTGFGANQTIGQGGCQTGACRPAQAKSVVRRVVVPCQNLSPRPVVKVRWGKETMIQPCNRV